MPREHLITFRPSDIARFWLKVNKSGDCWLWTAARSTAGYGRFAMTVAPAESEIFGAHRISYMIHRGAISSGMHVLHSCDIRTCVNPAHLRQGTPADNMRDRLSRSILNMPHGEAHPNSRLTADDAREVRSLRSSGMKFQELADRFGVSKGTICGVVYMRTWRHI